MLRLLVVLLFWAGSAAAASLAGASFPDTYPVEGQSLALNGLGLRTVTLLRVRVYVAGLYVARRSGDAGQIVGAPTPKVLLLQFLHSGSKREVEQHFREGETNTCGRGECDPDDRADYERMIAAAPAVSVGDTFTFVMTQRGVQFYGNKQLLASSAKPDLGRMILLGFIGPRPPSEELRSGLLGAGG
jgi:hypothetical protein